MLVKKEDSFDVFTHNINLTHSFSCSFIMPRASHNAHQQINQPPLPQHPNPLSMETDLGNLAITGMNQAGNEGSGHTSPAGQTQTDVPIIDVFGNSPGMSGLDQMFQRLALKPKEFVCEFFDLEMVSRRGTILQYVNTNSTGATCMVGGSRINVVDPRKIPLYLSRNVSFIRQHAVTALQTHFKYTHCATGALETLAPDDYSISFSWASLTDLGRQLNPYGRSDLPLAYSAYDNLITPLWLSKEDSFPTYVVNVFIQLQEATRRAPAVIQKAREEEQVRAEIAARPQKVINVNRPMNSGYNNNNRTDARIQKAVVATASATASAVGASISEAMKRAAPYERTYPPLPVGAPPEWNRSGRTPIPEN